MKNNVVVFSRGQITNRDGVNLDEGSVISKPYLDSINETSDNLTWKSDYANELLLSFFLKTKGIATVLARDNTHNLVFKDLSENWSSYVASAKASEIKVNLIAHLVYTFINTFFYIYSFLLVLISSFSLPILTIFLKRREKNSEIYNISIIRSPASYGKMKFLEESANVKFYYDNLFQNKSKNPSMYSFGSTIQRLFSVFIVPFMAVKDFFLIVMDSNRLLGWHYTGFVLYYYSKRIGHKCNYEYFLNLIFLQNILGAYYTGNKEDRFAVVEMRLCRKHGVNSICIPHGLEYSVKMPTGLPGNTFYCTTLFAQQYLSKLYCCDDKFIFDKSVALLMFSKSYKYKSPDKIVFFTESRDISINVKIVDFLVLLKYRILLKLHPKDDIINYEKYTDRIDVIHDFDISISNSICLARKSTVLVEALYNNSIPIAVLVDSIDRAYVEIMFPSLADPNISRVVSFEELKLVLDEQVNNYEDLL